MGGLAGQIFPWQLELCFPPGVVLPTQAHGWPFREGLGCQGWQRLKVTWAPSFPGSDKELEEVEDQIQ